MAEAIIVCGGRDLSDSRLVFDTLNALEEQFDTVVHGAAGKFDPVTGTTCGADLLAGQWARLACRVEIACPADWMRYGRSAGPRRNAEMLARFKPRLVVAFPGGRGTADMVRRAKAAGVPVLEVGSDG